MFQTFRNAWKIPELRNRLLFTLAILVVYRLGCAIPVPFVTGSALTQMFSNGNMLTYLDMMSGGGGDLLLAAADQALLQLDFEHLLCHGVLPP